MSEISLILVLPTNKISDMTRVAIKKENITSFGGIYHIIDVFSKLGFKNLPNLYWANVEVAAKHSVMEVFLALSSQHIEPQKDISTYKIFSQEKILRD